ncbi:MAG TPA: DUF2085 domain-containing protein [Pyrinomonadaceae bacterium]|jgi:uncharacterized membrane protein|nr:DUF2085 domain-containing protein [Pyrinomonadaceae bacterium]
MPLPVSSYVPQCAPDGGTARTAFVAWGMVCGGALALLGLILVAPLALARGYVTPAYILYGVFHAVCHQMSERSFHVDGRALAVCARCTGIYAGFVFGALLYPLVRSLRRRETPARAWLFVAALPSGADFARGVLGVWENTHFSRSMTGALLGAAAAFFVIPGAVDLAYTALKGKGQRVKGEDGKSGRKFFSFSLRRGITNT